MLFARKDDELSRALDECTLHRNFQGYSTHVELEMVALGTSGISMGETLFVQNTKEIGDYNSELDEARLLIKNVFNLSDEERI